MKKFVILFLILLLYTFTQLFCYTTVNSSTTNALNVGIDIPEVVLSEKEYRDGNTYSSIILPNAGQLTVGKPDVPGLANWILIPNGTNVSITTYPGAPNIIKNVDLAPVQLDPFDNVDSPIPPFAKDQVVYSTDTNFPRIFAEIESRKRKRGQECTILWIYPYQYNPVERTLTVYPDLEVSVNFNGIIKPIPANLINDRLIESLKSFAINADEVLQAEQSTPQTKSDRLERTDGCELLIITDPTYSSAANVLADWKTRRGIFTTVVTTSTTGSSASSIENYIDNAYDTWTPAPSYFLFVGDDEDIPAQNVTGIPTDFYYADRDDPVDWVADFGYGRLSVDTSSQADSLVARIMRYEKSPTTNSDYYDDILSAACFQDGEHWDNGASTEAPDDIANRRFCKTSEDVRNYLHDQQGYPWSQREYVAYNRVSGTHPGEIFPEFWNDTAQHWTFIFENDDPPDGGVEIPASMQKPTFPWDGNTADISSAFNNGVFFSLFRAHGSSSGWGDPDFHSVNVDALTNGEDRPIIWSITCQSGRFDDTECFAEHWIRHTTGGSCGILAATRNSYSGPNDRFIWGLMNAIWPTFDSYCSFSYGGSTPIYRMGDVKNYGINYMSTHYSGSSREDTINLFHWFGDPTMEMWTSQPSQLTNAYNTTDVNIGTSSMTVKVDPAVSGMLVCAYNENDDVFATATTNTSGYAYLSFTNPLTTEAYVQVTVTKHNYLPYEFNAGTNTWIGTYSTDWNNTANWSVGIIPDATINAIIPAGTPYQPTIGNSVYAYCKNLTIESGATITQNGTSYFYVYGNFDSDYGTFTQSGAAYLYFDGLVNNTWDDDNMNDTYQHVRINKDAPAYYTWMWQDMTVEQSFEIREGEFKIDGTWTLTVNGALTNAFEVETGGTLTLTDENIDIVNGDIQFYGGSQANVVGGLINCGDDFRIFDNTSYDIQFSGGSLNMSGTGDQYIEIQDAGSFLNDLVINKSSGSCIINYGDVNIGNDLIIEHGNFNSANYPVTVGGNWNNSGGTYIPGTSLVTFDSSGGDHDVDGTNTFYDVHQINQNKYLRFNGDTTILNDIDLDYFCWAYSDFQVDGTLDINDVISKFTANGSSANATIAHLDQGGTVFCNGEATITINDLTEFAIQGTYYAEHIGGVINISNGGAAVDLEGNLYINGGTMNLAGTFCYLAFTEDASIAMTDGVLDVTDCGIHLSGSNTLTETITGGTIRTSGDFTGARIDWNPTGGEIELYGPDDADLSMGAGSNLFNVNINKAVTDEIASKLTESKKTKPARFELDREGNPNEVTRAEIVTTTSDLQINGDLQIDSGTFDLNGFNVNVGYDVKNYGSLIVAASDTLDTGDDMFLYSGSDVDLAGTIYLGTRSGMYGAAYHYSGSTFNQTDGHYYIETIHLYNGSQFNGTGGYTHIYVNGATPATNTIDIDDPDSYFYRLYVDDGANAALIDCAYDLMINYGSQIRAPLDINEFEMSVQYFDVYDNGHLIIDDGGIVNVTGNGPYIHNTASLTMVTGSELNSASNIQFQTGSTANVSGGEIYLAGSFTDADNIFNPTDGTVTFDGSSVSYIYGPTVFHNLTVNKSTSTVYTSNAMDINGDFTINSGIFNTNGYDMNIAGNWANNVGITGFTEGTKTVTFDGAYEADILTSETFYNMIVDKTYFDFEGLELVSGNSLHILNDLTILDGTLEMNSNSILNIEHDVQIDLSAGLNAFSDTGLALYVGGNWVNDNTNWNTVSGYSPGTETVTFYGNSDQYITTAAPQEDFGNLVIDKSAGEFRSNDNIRIIGDLDILTGNWHDNVASLTHYFEGDVYVTAGTSAGFNSLPGNTVVFKGTADQTIYNPYGYYYFHDMIVDKTPWPTRSFTSNEDSELQQVRINNVNDETRALTVSLTSSIDLEHGDGITVEEGTLDLNGYELRTMGDIIINDGGKIIVDEGAELWIDGGDELAVNSGGILEVMGTAGNLATVTNRVTGYYDFNIYSGGTISAEYGLFEYMTINGVFVRTGGIVDPAHPFDYCTFQNGTVGFATLLLIDNYDDITITGANFPDDSSSDYNVAKTIEPPEGQGYITMVGSTGIFAGEDDDYDDYNRIDWETLALVPIDDLAINYNEGTNTIVLTWTYPVPVDQFRVYRSTDPYDFSSATVFTTSTVGYSMSATGTKYFYYVTAENITENVSRTNKINHSEISPLGK